MKQRAVNQVVVPLVGRTMTIWLCDQTEIPVASDNPKCPPRHPSPRSNSIETWGASDVTGCVKTRRTNKYGHESPKKYTQDSDCPHGTFQSSTPDRGLINNGVSKKFSLRTGV